MLTRRGIPLTTYTKFTTFTHLYQVNMPIQEYSSPITAFFARGKEVGFVCIKRGDLIDFGVKTIPGRRRGTTFMKRVEVALSPLLNTPERRSIIVVERMSKVSHTGGLCQALYQIAQHWKEAGYSVRFHSLAEVKQRLCDTSNVTHRELMEQVVERYAMLKGLVSDGKADKARYWEKVLMAMALAEDWWGLSR